MFKHLARLMLLKEQQGWLQKACNQPAPKHSSAKCMCNCVKYKRHQGQRAASVWVALSDACITSTRRTQHFNHLWHEPLAIKRIS